MDANNARERAISNMASKLSLLFIIIALLGFTILLLPFFFEDYNFDKLASLGDTVGGFLNPVIAIAAALLTFLAFYIQYQANKQVERQFEKQQIDDSITDE